MPTETVRIFVDAVPIDAVRGETVIEAVARWDAAVGEQLRSRERALTDSRGLAIGLETVVHGGAIFRVVSSRQLQGEG